jgi:hypothetical protein
MTTATFAIAGQSVVLKGGQSSAGGVGNGVGDVTVNAPLASGPVIGAAAGHPVTFSGFKEIGWPQADGVTPLPQFV